VVLGFDVLDRMGNVFLTTPQLFGLLFLPVGVGFLVWSFQIVVVSRSSVISKLFGFTTELDRSSCRIKSQRSDGFTVRDHSGQSIFVSNWMVNSDRLAEECGDREPNAGN
jgi:hypothetical protein